MRSLGSLGVTSHAMVFHQGLAGSLLQSWPRASSSPPPLAPACVDGYIKPSVYRTTSIDPWRAPRPAFLVNPLPYLSSPYRALARHLTCSPVASVWSAMRRRVRVPVLLLWGERDQALGPELIRNIEQV